MGRWRAYRDPLRPLLGRAGCGHGPVAVRPDVPRERGGLYSITLPGIADARVGKLLDDAGIAVRTGAHCAQPILARFGLTSTVRPSFSLYNTREEIDLLVETLRQISARR